MTASFLPFAPFPVARPLLSTPSPHLHLYLTYPLAASASYCLSNLVLSLFSFFVRLRFLSFVYLVSSFPFVAHLPTHSRYPLPALCLSPHITFHFPPFPFVALTSCPTFSWSQSPKHTGECGRLLERCAFPAYANQAVESGNLQDIRFAK